MAGGHMAIVDDDPDLGPGPSEDSEISLNDSEAGSLLSEDSLLPEYERETKETGKANTLYEACARNEACALGQFLERGVTKEEVMELDVNGRNGLMVAVSKGFVDIVYGLHTCPMMDINHQDNDGNTALMIAAQAGFVTILNYILNYFPGVDTEVRDPRGFTALIKAGLQGREECVSALLMHGADKNVIDLVRGRSLKEWALKTGRFETLGRVRRLQSRPIAVQFCENYVPEWPDLKQLVSKATTNKTASQKITQRLKDTLSFSLPHDPQENGVMDHMVRITTSIHSPLVVTACHPLCPTSPPEIGKRRLAVPELLAKHSVMELEESSVCHSIDSFASTSPSAMSATSASLTCCQDTERRESIISSGVRSFIPRSMARRNSVFPSGCIPKIEVTRSGEATPKKEKKKKRDKAYLEPPVWKYKEAKEEKKKEKLRLENEAKEKEKKMKKMKSKASKGEVSSGTSTERKTGKTKN